MTTFDPQLRDQFVKAVNSFKYKPALLRQKIKDAEMYRKEGQFTEFDIIFLKRLAMTHSTCVF